MGGASRRGGASKRTKGGATLAGAVGRAAARPPVGRPTRSSSVGAPTGDTKKDGGRLQAHAQVGQRVNDSGSSSKKGAAATSATGIRKLTEKERTGRCWGRSMQPPIDGGVRGVSRKRMRLREQPNFRCSNKGISGASGLRKDEGETKEAEGVGQWGMREQMMNEWMD
eukprot:GHVU01085328.1.p2 GENE.GHVU01085328.1~~GHVU01085328.1.p2  ORF type:complete len:168 (-),score=23.84 GHVU01085328.1:413-916(-)